MNIKFLIKTLLPDFIIKFIVKIRNALQTNANCFNFKNDFNNKSVLLADDRFKCIWNDRLPCLDDKTKNTSFDAHYVYHTAWAARILATVNPNEHIDIGSSLYFVSNVSAFVPIKFYDYRPATLNLTNLSSGFADIVKLPFVDNSVKSLSCMHVVEHIGLERYGDPFDPQGDLKAMCELERVLAPNAGGGGGCYLLSR